MSTKTVIAEHRPDSAAFLVDRIHYQEEPIVGMCIVNSLFTGL